MKLRRQGKNEEEKGEMKKRKRRRERMKMIKGRRIEREEE